MARQDIPVFGAAASRALSDDEQWTYESVIERYREAARQAKERQRWPIIGPTPEPRAAVPAGELRRYVPVNHEQRLRALETAVAQLAEALQDRPVTSSTSIVDLNSEEYSVRHPIPIVIEDWHEEVVATLVETEAFGAGATPSEALSELKRRIIALYEDLSSSDPEEFGKLPAAWWRVLQHYVIKHER